MKKKAIKIATASVMAVSSFAAVAPFTTEAAVKVSVSGVSAVNGSATIKFNKAVSSVKTSDFKVTTKIGSSSKTVKVTKVVLSKDKKSVTVTYDKVAVAKKDQSVSVSVSYKAAKAVTAKAFKVVGDSKAPTLSVSSVASTVTTAKQTLKVTAASDATKVVVSLNGKAVSGSKGAYALVLKEGSNTIVVTAADKLGNTASKTIKVTLNTPAAISSVSAVNGSATVKFTKALTATPIASDFKVIQAGKTVTPSKVTLSSDKKSVELTLPKVAVTEADVTVSVSVTYKGVAKTASFKVAKAVVSEVGAINAITVNEGQAVNLPGTVEVTLSNGAKAQKAVVWEQKDLSKAGQYTVKGNVADTDLEASVQVVVVDVTAPTLTFDVTELTTNENTFKAEGTVEQGAKVTVNGTEVTVESGKFSKEVKLSEGVNEVNVRSTDAGG